MSDKSELLGHPKCLFVLFFAEMWERFSFYGMKALLILYMVNYLFWKQAEASHVMAWYAGLVYATPIFGGLIADKFIGARWSVVIGASLMAIGHFLLAFEPMPFFYSGLAFLIAGNGFMKPNISTQVGALYRENDERRDSAFTIFYMGINLGAFIGPLICGWLRVNYGYHYGFAAAGVGMVAGLVVYVLGMSSVERRTRQIADEDAGASATTDAEGTGEAQAPEVLPAHVYRDRTIVVIVICVFAILFWVGFEQAANVMNLWAEKHTNLHVFQGHAPEATIETLSSPQPHEPTGWRDTTIAAEQTQSINPFFIITLAPVFAWLWTALEKRKLQPSTPMKMAMGVFFAALAYGVMLGAASAESKATSAPLARLPAGVDLEEYGATRLRFDNGRLYMNGVLTDLDWMRALGASSSQAYKEEIAELVELAEKRADEVRQAIRDGRLARGTSWEVQLTLPPELRTIEPVMRWPDSIAWDDETGTFTVTAEIPERYRQQLLAAGAEPDFREALNSIYTQSSLVKVSIVWLIAFYLLITVGELCLSPVGLSLVTKAAPPKYVGMFMGLWFFTTGAVANYLAHFMGGMWGTMTPTRYFLIFGIVAAAATGVMLLLLRVLKPMLHGLH
ncbi:MAG: peptide MFS transporter [Phycisphaerae bacterium]